MKVYTQAKKLKLLNEIYIQIMDKQQNKTILNNFEIKSNPTREIMLDIVIKMSRKPIITFLQVHSWKVNKY